MSRYDDVYDTHSKSGMNITPITRVENSNRSRMIYWVLMPFEGRFEQFDFTWSKKVPFYICGAIYSIWLISVNFT